MNRCLSSYSGFRPKYRKVFADVETRNLFSDLEERTLCSDLDERNFSSGVDERFRVAPQDVVFVTVTVMGRTVLSTCVTGRNSAQELIGELKGMLPGVEGILTVNMRNRSNGTVARRSVRLNKPSTGLLKAQMKGYAA